MTHGPMSFSGARMICNLPFLPHWNVDYSGKKRRRKMEKNGKLRRLHFKMKVLKFLELEQLSVLLLQEIGS